MNREINRIKHGDCIAGMAKLPDGCVDLAFADPPFNIGYEYDVYHDSKERKEYLDWSKRWIAEVKRVLKRDGTFWLAIGDDYAAELKLTCQEIGFRARSWVVWYYTFGVNCTRKFSRSHTHLFHFVKDPERFTFREDNLENRVPSARQLVYADSRANPQGRLPDDTWIIRPQDLTDCFTPAEDTWYFPRVAGTFKERAGFHGCQMPEQLLGRIIKTCSEEGDAVLDPFAGSGTTLVVAKKLGRRFLGFEISEEYARRGGARIDAIRRGDPLEGAAEPNMSAPATFIAQGDLVARKATQKNGSVWKSASSESAAATLKSVALVERGLTEALRGVSNGYSLDRVVADPELNSDLVEACRKLSLPGDVPSWNRMLFRMRKAGKLAHITTEKRTEISWEKCDPYLFASEIALTKMLEQGHPSLDEILCNPALGQEFDAIATWLAPGFKPVDYRWAALKLRKEAKLARNRATAIIPRLDKKAELRESEWQDIPDGAGVYLVTTKNRKANLYSGGALRLRERLRLQFKDPAIERWINEWGANGIRYTIAHERSPVELLAFQSRLIRKHHTTLNYLELAAA